MSWFRRRPALASAAAGLAVAMITAGCGFKPMYGGAGAVNADTLGEVWVAPIPNRSGQLVHDYLSRGLDPEGQGNASRYRLDVSVAESRSELGIRKDQTATRANLTLNASFTLVDLAENKVLYRATASVTNSYNVVEAQFATVAAEIDSLDRAARTLADNIRTRVAAYFARQGKVASQ